jgi:hypothetical protein
MSSSELNDFEQMVLDQRALDSSAVGGNSAYNANDLVYDSAVSIYDGTFTQLARSSASLNGLSASIESTVVKVSSAFYCITWGYKFHSYNYSTNPAYL